MEGTIDKYDGDFCGVVIDARGVEVSIPGTLVGETVRYHIEHRSPHAARAWGVCDGIVRSSCDRVRPSCPLAWPVAGPCPGCPLMHVSAKHQNAIKAQAVQNALTAAGITYIHDVVCRPAPESLHYRNRSDFVAFPSRGRLLLGAYRNRTHEPFAIRACPILRSPLNQVLAHVREAANRLRIPAFHPARTEGTLRYVSLFANADREVLVDFVCTSERGNAPAWISALGDAMRGFAPIRGASYSINDSVHNAIRVSPSVVIWGADRLPERHGGTASLYSASGFTQLNTAVAAQIYATAREWLVVRPRVAWDLYCGAGAFGRAIRPEALYGAEFSPSAIEAARSASAADPFPSTFEVCDLEKAWPSWPVPNAILADPPRKGLSQNVLRHLHAMRPPTVVYMSCNPETFARDVAALSDLYVLTRIEAFDMMPQTRQIETLGLLQLR